MAITIRMDDGLYEWIKRLAEYHGKSINKTVVELIAKAVEEFKEKIRQDVRSILLELPEDIWQDVQQLNLPDPEAVIQGGYPLFDPALGVVVEMDPWPDDPEYKNKEEEISAIRASLQSYWASKIAKLLYQKYNLSDEQIKEVLQNL